MIRERRGEVNLIFYDMGWGVLSRIGRGRDNRYYGEDLGVFYRGYSMVFGYLGVVLVVCV